MAPRSRPAATSAARRASPTPAIRWRRSARRLAELAPGVELMENLRFDPGEEANDPAFVDRLVEGQDLYVDDAFGAAHRAHASVVGPPARLPSGGGTGAGPARWRSSTTSCTTRPGRSSPSSAVRR